MLPRRLLLALALIATLPACTRFGFGVVGGDGGAADRGTEDQGTEDQGPTDTVPATEPRPVYDGHSDQPIALPEGGTADTAKRPDGATIVGPTHVWSKSLGGSSVDYGRGVAVDLAGNVYVTGDTQGTVDFGGGNVPGSGVYDVFVASYGPTGAYRWAKVVGSARTDVGRAIAVDASGLVYATGHFYDTVNFGGPAITSTGQSDIYVAAYGASGAPRWSKHFGNAMFDDGRGVAVDGLGNVYVTGHYSGVVDFGGGALVNSGSNDIFLASFSADGGHRWSRGFGGTGDDTGYAVATDGGGNVYLAGYFANAVDFGGGAAISAGGYDIFLVSYSGSGVYRWSKRFGSGQSDIAHGVAADAAGNVYITGSFTGPVDFGGGPLTGGGFLASYATTGAYRWARSFGTSTSDVGRGVALDGSGNVYFTGGFDSTVDLGGGTLTSAGATDIFVASYTSTGAHRWSKGYGGPLTEMGNAIAVSGSHVFVVGNTSGQLDFGGGSLPGAGGADAFVLKLKQ